MAPDETDESSREWEYSKLVDLINSVLSQAIDNKAEEFELHPSGGRVLLYTPEGEELELNPIPADLYAGLVARMEIMAGVDTALTGDRSGLIRMKIESDTYVFHVNTSPVRNGRYLHVKISHPG